MNYLIWIFAAYAMGSLITYYIVRRGILELAIETTISSLVQEGFLRHKRDQNGEIEILKWNEDANNE